MVCEVCGKKYEIVNSLAPTSKTCSKKCDRERRRTVYKGKNNPNWRGGINTLHSQIRTSIEYLDWRKSVFERDKYICQCCGKASCADITSHHLNAFASFPEQRMDIDNGTTLCEQCHRGFHSQYGKGNNTIQQFEQYVEAVGI